MGVFKRIVAELGLKKSQKYLRDVRRKSMSKRWGKRRWCIERAEFICALKINNEPMRLSIPVRTLCGEYVHAENAKLTIPTCKACNEKIIQRKK